MAIISMIRNIKITNSDAEKIINSKPSKSLEKLLKDNSPQKSTSSNKLIAKYLKKLW